MFPNVEWAPRIRGILPHGPWHVQTLKTLGGPWNVWQIGLVNLPFKNKGSPVLGLSFDGPMGDTIYILRAMTRDSPCSVHFWDEGWASFWPITPKKSIPFHEQPGIEAHLRRRVFE